MSKTDLNLKRSYYPGCYCLLAFTLALISGGAVFAQSDSANYHLYEVGSNDFHKESLSSDSLTSISSLIPLSAQDAPGSITIFTKEDIISMGARDLIDLLNLVPGFYFGSDIEGATNPGVRGNIAQEAVLLMVDGVEMNDLLYGSLPTKNRFSIDQFEKVEVIRGPGSAVQGGFATYAVINITTKAANRSRGFNISNLYGRTRDGESRQSTSISVATGGYGWQAGAVASLSRAVAGTGLYVDNQGNAFDMAKSNTMSDKFVSTYLAYKGLSLQFLANTYDTKNRDSYKTISHGAHNVDFSNKDVQLKYHLKFGRTSEIIPQLSYTAQQPWFTSKPEHEEDSAIVLAYDRWVQRISGGAVLNSSPTQNFKISLGINQRWDKATNNTADYPFYNGKNEMNFNVLSVFSQVYVKTGIANIVLGGRLEKHNKFATVFAPRIAFSRRMGSFCTKIGYTRSFKMPTFENFNLSSNQRIKPQYTSAIEGEVQYLLNSKFEAFLNVFRIDTKNGIAYTLADDYLEGYSNCGIFSTKGAEAGIKTKFKAIDFSASYSFYTNRNLPSFYLYKVENTGQNLAFPANKLSFVGNVAVTKGFRINTNILYMSSRYSFDMDSSGKSGVYRQHPSNIVINAFATVRVPIGYGLEAGFGVKDIFNQGVIYIQPYASYHRPLPGLGREYLLRITYELSCQ